MPGEPRSKEELTLRPFSCQEEYEACTDFQEEAWGRGFSEKVSAAILMIANRLGGLAAGAFDGDGVLQGFVFGLTGLIDGKLVHWSDMLAVREEGRDQGLGTRLKRYQRDVLLERGVGEMRWTFDPLQARNAHVNFSKLGVVSREYVENMYGETDSPLHRGIGTDRLVVIWDLGLERPEESAEQEGGGAAQGEVGPFRDGFSDPPMALSVLGGGPFPLPGSPVLGLDDSSLLLPVPALIDRMMEEDNSLAVLWREATREAFVHYLSRGYEARDFLRGDEVSFYLLTGPGGGAEGGKGRAGR